MFIFISLQQIMPTIVLVILLHAGTIDVSAEMAPLSQSPLFPELLRFLSSEKYAPDNSEKINDEYDYIVVGGGTAGSVVASRLSEEPCATVLLLEAGPKPPPISDVPGLWSFLLGTEFDWKFKTVPQKHLEKGIKNKQLMWNTGKMLGGSGNHNGMLYVRANRKNYDNWAAQGATGWSYKDVLPYFLKLEDNRDFQFLKNGYHSIGGPITVEKPHFISRSQIAFSEAVRKLGYEFVDSNGAKQTGIYDFQMNIRNSRRCSSVKGYLVPAEHRPNLDIQMNSTVTKVIIKDKRATGVEFYHNGGFRTVRAKKEVIVSGGTVNTPKLLMLSGIGPRDELQKWNIPVIADLPVGKNFQDHGGSSYFFTLDPQFSLIKGILDSPSIREYINYRSGPLSTAILLLAAFLNGSTRNPDSDFPNFTLYFREVMKESENSTRLEPEIYRKFFGPIDGNRTICVCVSHNMQPRSRGTVTLRSNNPFDPPVLDPHYLEDPKDLDDIVDGLKVCKKIVNTAAVRSLGGKPFETLMPGCEAYVNSDDDYFRCFAKRYFQPYLHAVGTSKMGNKRDPSTVVDPELRVKGVNGLRVVDGSVMPIILSGNTNTPIMMVAEKASDLIKKSIQCLRRGYFGNIYTWHKILK